MPPPPPPIHFPSHSGAIREAKLLKLHQYRDWKHNDEEFLTVF